MFASLSIVRFAYSGLYFASPCSLVGLRNPSDVRFAQYRPLRVLGSVLRVARFRLAAAASA